MENQQNTSEPEGVPDDDSDIIEQETEIDMAFNASKTPSNEDLQMKTHFQKNLQMLLEYYKTTEPIDDLETFALMTNMISDPISYKQAMQSKEKLQWKEAIDEELKSMKDKSLDLSKLIY